MNALARRTAARRTSAPPTRTESMPGIPSPRKGQGAQTPRLQPASSSAAASEYPVKRGRGEGVADIRPAPSGAPR
jgi:hypothetical protein